MLEQNVIIFRRIITVHYSLIYILNLNIFKTIVKWQISVLNFYSSA